MITTLQPKPIRTYPLTMAYFRQLAVLVGTDWRCIWSAWAESEIELTGRPGLDRRACLEMNFPAPVGWDTRNN